MACMSSGESFFPGAAEFGRMFFQQVICKKGDVFAPFSKRRHLNRKDVYPVEQVFPEFPSLYFFGEISVCGTDHSHVHMDGFVSPSGLISFSWSTRRSFVWIPVLISPISSKNIVPR